MDDPKYPIAIRHNLYIKEVRDAEIEKATDEIEEVCLKYGVDSLEFGYVVESARVNLYENFDWVDDDDDDYYEAPWLNPSRTHTSLFYGT